MHDVSNLFCLSLGRISLDGLDRIVVDEFHEILDSSKAAWLAALQELWTEGGADKTALWGLTGTPPLSDFASVARIAQAGHCLGLT